MGAALFYIRPNVNRKTLPDLKNMSLFINAVYQLYGRRNEFGLKIYDGSYIHRIRSRRVRKLANTRCIAGLVDQEISETGSRGLITTKSTIQYSSCDNC